MEEDGVLMPLRATERSVIVNALGTANNVASGREAQKAAVMRLPFISALPRFLAYDAGSPHDSAGRSVRAACPKTCLKPAPKKTEFSGSRALRLQRGGLQGSRVASTREHF